MDSLDLKMEMYKLLRQEVLASIKIQQETFIIELISIILGSLGIFRDIGILSELTTFDMRIFLFLIAPTASLFTLVWLTEQSRIMRNGNFLELIEDEINYESKSESVLWENWLRRENVHFWDVHNIHHYCQFLLIVSFIMLGFYSIWRIFDVYGQYFVCVIYLGLLICISILFGFTIFHTVPSWLPSWLYKGYNHKTEFESFKGKYRSLINSKREEQTTLTPKPESESLGDNNKN